MSNYTTLVGAEDVSRAGYAMRDAADNMQRAASQIDAAVDRMAQALAAHAEAMERYMESQDASRVEELLTYIHAEMQGLKPV